MNRILFFFLFFLLWTGRSFAQQETGLSITGKDTVLVPGALREAQALKSSFATDTTPFVTPKKTALFSAIVPGLGQFHNKHYWKIPVIYSLVGVSIYFLNDNSKNYNQYRRLSAKFIENPTEAQTLTSYDASQVNQLKDYYRRNLDLTALFTALGYTLQVIDAVVFAHLKGFDISDDISLRVQPVLIPQGGAGFGLVMKF